MFSTVYIENTHKSMVIMVELDSLEETRSVGLGVKIR